MRYSDGSGSTICVARVEGLAYYSSPVGDLLIASKGEFISEVCFLKTTRQPEIRNHLIDACIEELDEYFYRGRKFFSVPIDLKGSIFQKKVWEALLEIPYGKTVSYYDIAVRVGDLKSIRAVGLANGQNPFAIIVPCHRVIGKNGDLVGYGGGIENKTWLLRHEGSLLHQLSLF